MTKTARAGPARHDRPMHRHEHRHEHRPNHRPARRPSARTGHQPRPALRGFTLVEVLVALAIVAIALAAGVRAAGSMTQSAERLTDVTAAHWCADNQLTQLRLAQQYPNVGDSAFSCEQLGRTYAGQLQATTTPNPNFRLVSAAVLNAEGQVLVRLSTVMGRF